MKKPKFPRVQWALHRLLQQIQRQPQTILMFHSVGRSPEADFLPSSLDCDPEFFEKVLRLLCRHATVLPLRELVAAISAGRVPRNAVALTLDDGFRDNYTTAWPLLRDHKLPATFFLPTDAVGASELLPIHKFYYLTNYRKVAVPKGMDLDSPERRLVIEELCADLPSAIPPLGEMLYMNWQQVQELADNGLEIGAHTCSHPWIAAIAPKQQRAEIVGSKEILENRLGRSIRCFAFPYGHPCSVNPTTLRIVHEHFDVACLAKITAAGSNDPWRLPRTNIAELYVS